MANPIVAAIASFLIPGIGQIYAGDIKRGIMFLIIAIIFAAIGYTTSGIYQIISIVVDVFYCLFVLMTHIKLLNRTILWFESHFLQTLFSFHCGFHAHSRNIPHLYF